MTAALQLATVHGAGAAEEKVGVVVLALLSGVALVGHRLNIPRRLHLLSMLAALVLTPVLLAVDIWNTSPMRHLRGRPLLAAGAVLVGLLLVAGLALLFARRPRAFPLVAVFAVPFRLPISSAGTTANLLVPLYLVVAGGVLAYLWPRLRGAAGGRADDGARGGAGAGEEADRASSDGRVSALLDGGAPAATDRRTSGWRIALSKAPGDRWIVALQWLLAASVLLYAIQAAYSADFSKALQNIVFFYVPFSLMFVLLRDVRWDRRLLLACAGVAIGLAIVFAGVGFVEYQRKALFLNPKVVAANHYDSYFRVNSVFFDPNIYGRFLALVMLIIATIVLWARRRRQLALGALALAWLWGGLITSFSQSSMAALLFGLVALAAFRWDARRTIYVTGALLAIGVIALLAAPPSSLHLGLTGAGGSANNATNGRVRLVEGGLQLFSEEPVYGWGSGAFATEYRNHQNASTPISTSASHTIPITVAAEQGVIGLLLYLLLLLACLVVLLSGAGRSPPRTAIAACFLALLLHTMAYADFLEDPVTWTLLGIGVALATLQRQREGVKAGGDVASAPAPEIAKPAVAPG